MISIDIAETDEFIDITMAASSALFNELGEFTDTETLINENEMKMLNDALGALDLFLHLLSKIVEYI